MNVQTVSALIDFLVAAIAGVAVALLGGPPWAVCMTTILGFWVLRGDWE